MTGADTARTVIGIIGNVISFALFASPFPTFWRIWKKRSVEEFSPDPYLATVMNCMFWIFYGLPVVHPNSTLVVTINSIGLAVELIYLTIYFVFAPNKGRLKVIGVLCLELAFMAAVVVVTLTKLHTHASRSNLVGIFCVVFGVLMYASPLTVMKKVITTKSVEFMPFYLSLTNFLNGLIWLTYALIQFDLYITIGNGLGAVSGAIQLILYACYYKSTPKDKEGKEKGKSSEVELASPKRLNKPTPQATAA